MDRKTILLVEDDSSVREIIGDTLQSSGPPQKLPEIPSASLSKDEN